MATGQKGYLNKQEKALGKYIIRDHSHA